MSEIKTLDGYERIAIVDIGSNTVRLVVFDALAELPIPIFNESVVCAMGKGLGQTGILNPNGIDLAMRALKRFIKLVRELQVQNFVMLATAAVRDASDGEAFVKKVKNEFGCSIQILSGAQEAELGAMGIISGFPGAQGLFADLGGGSLDIITRNVKSFGVSGTLPLGHIRVAEDSQYDRKKAIKIIEKRLEQCPWLSKLKGKTLYAIGGSWRAIALLYIEQIKYPLHVLDNFTMNNSDARTFTKLLGQSSSRSFEKMGRVALSRAQTMPYAALVLNRLIKVVKPKDIIFSGYGLREGQFFKMLNSSSNEIDPLINACTGFALRSGRFSINGEEIASWMAPLFAKETDNYHRLCHAAALLSDIGWTEHPDYRAIHSFIRVLRFPISGITHRQRVMLAIAILIRYKGNLSQYEVKSVKKLISQTDQNRAQIMGLALRFAHLISGGVPGILPKTKLRIKDRLLELRVDNDSSALISTSVERLFLNLGSKLKLEGRIEILPNI
jgi:exopolyphosphatase / guanosine-5'-triphosphate,3'-diphosphate pyrophosphatase